MVVGTKNFKTAPLPVNSIPAWQKASASIPDWQKKNQQLTSTSKTPALDTKDEETTENKDADAMRELTLEKATTKLPTPPKVLVSATFPYLVSSIQKSEEPAFQLTQTTPKTPDLTASTQHYKQPLSSNTVMDMACSPTVLQGDNSITDTLQSEIKLEKEPINYDEDITLSNSTHPKNSTAENIEGVTEDDLHESTLASSKSTVPGKIYSESSGISSYMTNGTTLNGNGSSDVVITDSSNDSALDTSSIFSGETDSLTSSNSFSELSRFKIADRKEDKDVHMKTSRSKRNSRKSSSMMSP